MQHVPTHATVYDGTPLWCTPVERVFIPADATAIAPGSFAYHSLAFDGAPAPGDLEPEGPVWIDVDPANPRYRSVDGSLVDCDGTLLSVWYENMTDLLDVEQSGTLAYIHVPDGVVRLAPKSIPFHSGRDRLVLDLPESLVEIQPGALSGERVCQVNFGPSLVSVADDFWSNLSDNDPSQIRSLRLRAGCRVTVHPLNRAFRAEKNRVVLPPRRPEIPSAPSTLPARVRAYGTDRLSAHEKDLLETLKPGDGIALFPAADPATRKAVTGVGTSRLGIAAYLPLDPATLDFGLVRARVATLVSRAQQQGRRANPVLEVSLETVAP